MVKGIRTFPCDWNIIAVFRTSIISNAGVDSKVLLISLRHVYSLCRGPPNVDLKSCMVMFSFFILVNQFSTSAYANSSVYARSLIRLDVCSIYQNRVSHDASDTTRRCIIITISLGLFVEWHTHLYRDIGALAGGATLEKVSIALKLEFLFFFS